MNQKLPASPLYKREDFYMLILYVFIFHINILDRECLVKQTVELRLGLFLLKLLAGWLAASCEPIFM
jgi:hypothetical protein